MIARINERVTEVESEGVFRISGSVEKVEELLSTGESYDFADATFESGIHEAASALKITLDRGAIFTPVQLQTIYEAMKKVEAGGNELTVDRVRKIVKGIDMDDGKKQVFNRLIMLFKKIVANESVTKMTVSNLTTTVATRLFFPVDPLRSIVTSAVLRQTGASMSLDQYSPDEVQNMATIVQEKGRFTRF